MGVSALLWRAARGFAPCHAGIGRRPYRPSLTTPRPARLRGDPDKGPLALRPQYAGCARPRGRLPPRLL